MLSDLRVSRKGITPVIAIILLLMMTVAAAGGAYAWLTQLQDQFQNRAEEDTDRSMAITDLRCFNDGVGYVEVFFRNSGSTELDLNPVDMNMRSAATGNVNYTLTETSLSLAQGQLSDSVSVVTQGNEDFSDPQSSAAYNISLSDPLEQNARYEVEFIFTDEDGETLTAMCQPSS